jgi:hypothetical protein
MTQHWIDEARDEDIHESLAALDQPAIGIHPPPFFAGHHAQFIERTFSHRSEAFIAGEGWSAGGHRMAILPQGHANYPCRGVSDENFRNSDIQGE